MPSYKTPFIAASEITPRSVFLNRRHFMAGAGAIGLAGIGGSAFAALDAKKSSYTVADKITPKEDATTYNNFYEFGTGKGDPAAYSGNFKPFPWKIKIDGMVAKPMEFDVEELIATMPLEERVYRFRCVEAWSMVLPCTGFMLSDLLKKVEPLGSAKYVAMRSAARQGEMPGVDYPVLEWPYREGLRLDEAMHPLTIMAVGIYGDKLPNQNGAPIRLVVPWKYGFKSIKSIETITFTDTQPETSWNMAASSEYGFYSNVNPERDHPRWSQASERVLGTGGGFFGGGGKRDTEKFNGYGAEVASLYAGMDLIENY